MIADYKTFFARFKRNEKGCLEWQGSRHKRGYGQIRIKQRLYLTHRIVWLLKRGKIPKGINILHECDNPPCGNIKHLFLGTHLDNMRDKVLKGRSGKGNKKGTKLVPLC